MSFKICENTHKNWNIKTFENFYINIKNSLEEFDNIVKFIDKTNYEKTFRWSLELNNVQYLSLINPLEKCVCIYSKNLFFEKIFCDFDEEVKLFISDLELTPLSNTPSFIHYNSIVNELPLFIEDEFSVIGGKTIEIANKLKSKVSQYDESIFEKMSNFALDLTAKYSLIRIHVLKFLAILPNLDHDEGDEIKRVFLETLRRLKTDSENLKLENDEENLALPFQYIVAVNIVSLVCTLLPSKSLAKIIRKSVSLLAQRFIAGTDISDAKKALTDLKSSRRSYTIDQLGELVVSNVEADHYMDKVIEIIDGLRTETPNFNDANVNEEHVSIKISALSNDFRPYAFESVYSEVSVRLKKILVKAKECNVFINVDAEHFHYRDIVLKIFKKLLLEDSELRDFKFCGIVLQAYLKDSFEHFNDILSLAKEAQIQMPIRLVKGAYWDAETIETKAHNLESFQFLNKEETDLNFRQMCYLILKNHKHLKLAVASHNILDHSFAEALREVSFPDAGTIEHQCLHMTYEALSNGLSKMGYPTRNYIPVGELLVGMAYLVRRIMENSSQVGILTIMRSHKGEITYNNLAVDIDNIINSKKYVYSNSLYKIEKTFKNIYPCETYREKNINRLNTQISKVRNVSLENLSSSGTADLIEKLELLSAESIWTSDSNFRSKVLLSLSYNLLLKRDFFSALIMKEAKKTLEEAIADVDEAIDFISFYLKEALTIEKEVQYSPKGIFGVIAPWNFPLAIPVGMSVAALATGNKVLLKPSEKTPVIMKEFYQLALDSGVPENVFQIIYGAGEIGAALTNHDLVDGIVFTGSKNVGVNIYKNFKPKNKAKVPTVITEMGGKNAVVVTNNAELDETVFNLLYSSFAHAGQKCSASSRIIIDNNIKEAFLKRFIQASKDLKIGSQFDLSTYVNPLIGKEEKELTIKRVIESSKEATLFGGTVHLDRSQESSEQSVVGPVIIELPMSRALNKESMSHQEFFAPVVHVIGYDSIDDAINLFNATDYALTGGIFSQSTDDYEYLMSKLDAGNLYINRSNTGARVAIEPFGGFKMSGTGPKAGSKEYLYSFINFAKDEPYDLTKSFSSYLKDMSLSYPNRQIPGQVNYTTRTKHLGSGMFVVDSPLSLSDKIEIAMAKISGNDVTIYQVNPDFIQHRDQDFFEKFTGNKLEVVETFSKSEYLKYDFLVGNQESLNIHSKGFIDTSHKELKKVYNFSDYKDDFHLYLYKYTHAKSFAINIMRHGAALGIQKDI